MKRTFVKTHLRNTLFVLIFVLSVSAAFAQTSLWTDPATGLTFTPVSGTNFNGTNGADKACDGNTTTNLNSSVSSTAPVSVVVQTSSAVKIAGYSITTASDATSGTSSTNYNPKNWTVSGSNNGTDWTTIATVTNDAVLQKANSQTYYFSCTNDQSYTYYKFEVTAAKGGSNVHFSEFHPMVATSVEAAGYVMFSGTNYLTTSTSGTTTFNPSTCLWTRTGNKFKNGSYYLYLGGSSSIISTSSHDMTLGRTESGTNGQTVKYDEYYLYYNSGWKRIEEDDVKGSTNYKVAFSVTKNAYPEVEVEPTVATTKTIFSDEGDASTYSHTEASYRPAFFDYVFYANTHHYCLTETSNATAELPAAETFTYTWGWENSPEAGHVTLNASTGEVTYDHYFNEDTRLRLKLTAQSTTTPSRTYTVYSDEILFEAPKVDPTNVSATDMTLYVGSSQNAAVTLTPYPCYRNLEFISANTDIATVSNTGVVTGESVGNTTVTVKAYEIGNTTFISTTFAVTVKDVVATPVISFVPIDDGETATATITCTTSGASIYYTTDGSEPSATSGTLYSAPFTVDDQGVVKAIAVMPSSVTDYQCYDNSAVATAQYSKCTSADPTIVINGSSVTFTSPEDGVTFYYTTNGDTPTTSSTSWTSTSGAITTVPNEAVIKVIAKLGTCQPSAVVSRQYFPPSGVSGSVVILNDLEDHNWTYYAGVDASVDGGHYNTDYLGKMYSPAPRNVKITYRGGGVEGASAVAISGATGENQNEMVYYETIEKTQIGENANYAYHVIPNPFSKRPKLSTQYYGFGGWKLVSGGKHITEYSNGATLPLEPTIHFTDLDDDYTPNCTSAEIVFEATWVPATVKVQSSKPTFDGGTYETNFWVLSANPGSAVTLSQNMTFTQVTPDGGATADYRNNFTMTRDIAFSHGDGVTPKIEFMNRNNNEAFNPNGKNLYIGRGVTNLTTSEFYGSNGNSAAVNQVIRVESGNFSNVYHYHATPGSVTKHIVTWGCDYDRAKGVNTNLTIAEALLSDNYYITSDESKYTALIYIKSGRFAPNGDDNDGGANLYYVGMKTTVNSAKDRQGLRYMEIQGGELRNIAGASTDHKDSRETIAFRMRMKGGTIHGMAFGCARGNPSYGSRAFILTGGSIEGWITPGSNGNNATLTGYLYGRTYLYAGGDLKVDSEGSTARMNRSVGGNLFGSGCGYDDTRTTGGCELGSNVVVADNVYVERGVYAGGSFGYSDGTSYIYITGGHVAGASGGISSDGTTYNADIQGGVYGGSCQNKGKDANIYMTGGLVESGIYGGSNRKGEMSGYTKILITGGTVNGNVHGGGFGENTVVCGNVDVTIGTRNTSTGETAGTAVINGDVYGGSALGRVNATATTNTSGEIAGWNRTTNTHTNVTFNAGTINGNLYGGALGQKNGVNGATSDIEANVYGPVQVTMNGGEVRNVFGCNNINGAPLNSAYVLMTGGEVHECVYGGGNAAAYNAGSLTDSPKVKMTGGTVNQSVFGGGLGSGAIVTGNTHVIITGTSHIKQNVYGGGNGGLVTGNTHVDIGGE